MKVIVKKYLNVRVGKPSVNAPCYQYLAPGSEIEVDGEEYTGDPYDGIDTWYRDEANNYYWSGGVSFNKIGSEKNIRENSTKRPLQEVIDSSYQEGKLIKNIIYHDQLITTDNLTGFSGKNVNVGIMDSSILMSHKSIKKKINKFQDINIQKPASSHGTFISALIGANGNLTGIAPKCNLFEFPIYDEMGSAKYDWIVRILNHLIPYDENMILNVSQDISQSDELVMLMKQISERKNILIVAAAGSDDELLEKSIKQFPASLPDVLAVGSISKSFYNSNVHPEFNKGVDTILPEFNFVSATRDNNNAYGYDSGDSMACGIVSGLVCLMLEANIIPDLDHSNVYKALVRNSKKYSDNDSIKYLNLIRL